MDNRVFKEEFNKWISRFKGQSEKNVDEWLKGELAESLGTTETEADGLYDEILRGIDKYEQNRKAVREAYENGQSKEEWMEEQLLKATSHLDTEGQMKAMCMIYEAMEDAIGEDEESGESGMPKMDGTDEFAGAKALASSIAEMAEVRMFQVLGEDFGNDD